MAAAGEDRLRAIVISASMAALGLVLPVAFHAVGLGSEFLPMLLPLLLNGFLVPLRWAALTGLAVPLLSAAVTGMPPLYPPVAVVLSAEAAAMGTVAATVYGRRRRLWLALLAAIAAGRMTAVLLTWVLARVFLLPARTASLAILIQGLPGVALQVAVVPLVVRSLSKRGGVLFSDER
jgi:hypothetical protein